MRDEGRLPPDAAATDVPHRMAWSQKNFRRFRAPMHRVRNARLTRPPGGDPHDPLLFPPHAQPGEDRALFGRSRSRLRDDPGRHEQGRAAHARVPGDQPERQGAGDRRHGRTGRQGSAGLRFHGNPALSRREDRKVPRKARGPGGALVLAAGSPASPCISSSPRPRAWITPKIDTDGKPNDTIRC